MLLLFLVRFFEVVSNLNVFEINRSSCEVKYRAERTLWCDVENVMFSSCNKFFIPGVKKNVFGEMKTISVLYSGLLRDHLHLFRLRIYNGWSKNSRYEVQIQKIYFLLTQWIHRGCLHAHESITKQLLWSQKAMNNRRIWLFLIRSQFSVETLLKFRFPDFRKKNNFWNPNYF